MGVRLGIAPAIGLMLMNIGFGSNAGIYSDKGGPFYVMRDFFGSLTPGLARDTMGSGYSAMVLAVVTMFIGLLLSLYLLIRKLKVPFYLVCLLLVLSIGQAKLSSLILIHLHHLRVLLCTSIRRYGEDNLIQVQFSGFVEIGWFTAITLIITFCIIDMFDTIGTLVGTASRAGMVDEMARCLI